MSQKAQKKIIDDDQGGGNDSTLLSLSLFIILLAFFIVLNGISKFSDPKVDMAFSSLDMAFDTQFIEAEFDQKTADERSVIAQGEGDSLEDIHGILRSVLPGLDARLVQTPNAGNEMILRVRKDQFERLHKQLLPVFARILKIKDGGGLFRFSLTSFVRDSFSKRAVQSFDIIRGYKEELVTRQGIARGRIDLLVEKGNPAFLKIHFVRSGQ